MVEDESYMSLAEIAELEGVTRHRISQIITGAFNKIALSVFKEINSCEPTPQQLKDLAQCEEFQYHVVEELKKK